MNFQTAGEAAKRLGVTVRAVQKWAKEGKIQGAHKIGRDWMIPEDACAPNQKDVHTEKKGDFFLVFGLEYELGKLWKSVNSIKDDEQKAIALFEYCYFTGKLKECVIAAEPYLSSKCSAYRFSASLFCVFANLCREHRHATYYAANIVRQEYEKSMKSDSMSDKAGAVLLAMSLKTQLHIPFENVPPIFDYLKYLSGGKWMIAGYLAAYKAYLEKDYSRSLGIVQTALNYTQKNYTIPSIYLNIIAAIDCMNLMQVEKAKQYIEKAWVLAEPDGIIMPFVEHYSILLGLIELYMKKNHQQAYTQIINTAKMYNTGWYEIYNFRNEQQIAVNLTPTEFTIAMLYSRNWRAKEIAAHMELSERTITNYIQIIYEKLHINGRKELEKYMLQ